MQVGLDERIEKHRQEKILREELKKIARERLNERTRRRASQERKKAVEKLLPKVEEQIVVDPAMKELAVRELQRRKLVEFVKAYHPKYLAGWVHYDICQRLEKFSQDVADGKSPRLMILMPPRHGKSQIASKSFPAWHLGKFPDHEMIACSYNIALAVDFSTDVRDIMRSERYSQLFPKAKLNPKDQAVTEWKLTAVEGILSGGYVAAGIGGPINGKGAHVLLIDDPIKNEEEAGSKEHLEKVARWYRSTAYTRLAPGGGVLLIQTWWSDMDLAGILQDEAKADPEADQFEVVKYPAIAVEDEAFRLKGEALHPERFPLPALKKIRTTLGGETGRFWNALYQQNPVPDEGAMFTKDMFVWRTTAVPESCHVYYAWDFAIGEKRYNDWTVGIAVAVDYDDNAHVIDLVRLRTGNQLKIADEMLDMWGRHSNSMVMGVEDGQIWRGVKLHLQKRMQERRMYPTVEELKPLTDKLARAQTLQGRMQQRKVTFPQKSPWVSELYKEMLRFPVGRWDDQVDALSWCARVFAARAAPTKPKWRGQQGEETVAKKLARVARLQGGTSAMLA